MTPSEIDQLLDSRQPDEDRVIATQPNLPGQPASAPVPVKPNPAKPPPTDKPATENEWPSPISKMAEMLEEKTFPFPLSESSAQEISTKAYNEGYEHGADYVSRRIPDLTADIAGPTGRFWQAVTWDLHLTASGLIIFTCLAIAKFWPSHADAFNYLVGLAATYLIGNTTGKTLPTKDGQ